MSAPYSLLYCHENEAHREEPFVALFNTNALIDVYEESWGHNTILDHFFKAQVGKGDPLAEELAKNLSKIIHSDENIKRKYWEHVLEKHEYSEKFEP